MSELHVDSAVRARYAAAAQERVAELCCPVDYDPAWLKVIPAEILERDYGCGDPSKYVRSGETVLDLGSGGGKICYIAAQVVGPAGRVIGVDCNPDMLHLARRHQPQVAQRLGYDNVEFRHGRIQDLRLDLDRLDAWLAAHPVQSLADWQALQVRQDELRRDQPLVTNHSVDVIVSNCVLNLVRNEDRQQLFAEMFRVLKPGGRAVISDITADRDVPRELQQDATLWSGCISGAYREDQFLQAFAAAGFVAVEIVSRQAEPWTVVNEIEFRSVTVRAFKPTEETRRADVMYRGPWRAVETESGQRLERGIRTELTGQDAANVMVPTCQQEVIAFDWSPGAPGPLPLLDDGACCSPKGCC